MVLIRYYFLGKWVKNYIFEFFFCDIVEFVFCSEVLEFIVFFVFFFRIYVVVILLIYYEDC